MFKMSGISKTYSKSAKKAVDNLELTIPDGQIFGFLGPNGAGKTTTIRILTGSLKADSGNVEIDGLSMTKDPIAAKMRIGLVNDNPELFNKMKANEFLNFVADVYRVPAAERRERIVEYSTRFDLDDALTASIGSYSRGMKQKLSIVASLLNDPPNWILDEPIVGLDPQASFELKEIMRGRAKSGKCVFFSTHVMEVAERVCDRLAIIDKGKIIFSGSLGELRELRNGKPGEIRTTETMGDGAGKESLEQLFLELVDESDQREGDK
jgi:ABC-2 type transport system ATP-binding protein